MGITEKKPWTAQPCLTAMSEEVPEAEGSAALGPSALAPTEHRARVITAGLTYPFLPPHHTAGAH